MLGAQSHRVYNAQVFIAGVQREDFVRTDFSLICMRTVMDAILELGLHSVYHHYPEIHVISDRSRSNVIAPSDIYGRVLLRCVKELHLLDRNTQILCLQYLNSNLSRSNLRAECLKSLTKEELTNLLVLIYTKVIFNPSPSTFPIWISEMGDKIDFKSLPIR